MDYIAHDTDASGAVQAAVDSSRAVTLPAGRLRLDRPVYLSHTHPSGFDLAGHGRATTLVPGSGNHDCLVAIPQGHRHYDPAPHLAANTLSAGRWAFRTNGTAGIRFRNTPFDSAKATHRFWSLTRKFTIDATLTLHDSTGGICGMIRPVPGGESGASSPWRLSVRADWPGWADLVMRFADGVERFVRFRIGEPSETPFSLRVRVDLDAGEVVCERDGTAVEIWSGSSVIPPGAALVENDGAAFWLGGLCAQDGGTPQIGSADVTFHSFRLWETATPPAFGAYDPFGWFHESLVYPTFAAADRPRAGDPAVRYTGQVSGFGYLTPFTGEAGDVWVKGLRVRGVSFEGHDWGCGLSLTSALETVVESVVFQGGACGLRVTGGPLNNYPVRVRDVWGGGQRDCLLSLQRCAFVSVHGVTAKYQRRGLIRLVDCDAHLSDVFHAPGGDRQTGVVIDLQHCTRVTVERFCSNYEDGVGPRLAHVRLMGPSLASDPHQQFVFRTCSGDAASKSPDQKFVVASGLNPAARVVFDDAFGVNADWRGSEFAGA